MSYWMNAALSYCIIISVIISIFKYKRIVNHFRPFVFSLWFNFLGCISSTLAAFFWRSNAIVHNIYFIGICMLVLWQFNQWGLFSKYRHLFKIVLLTFVFVWVIDNFIIGSPFLFNPYARIINSFLIVLMSIQLLSDQLLASWQSFWKNSVLLILFSYIIYFVVKILVEVSWQFGTTMSDSFMITTYFFYSFVNFLVNIIYVPAVIWIPVKPKFT